MTSQPLDRVGVQVDRVATVAAYQSSPTPDPKCCNACATFVLAANRGALPRPVLALLEELGVDVAKPMEAWGIPESGLLQIWWPFIAKVQPRPSDRRVLIAEKSLECRITADYPHPDWSLAPGFEMPAVELTWTSEVIKDLEREAWPETS